MSPSLVVGLLLLSSLQLVLSTCPPPIKSNLTTMVCYLEGRQADCTQPQPVGTWAEVVCKLGYTSDDEIKYRRISCTDAGVWDKLDLDCRPDCGRRISPYGFFEAGGEEPRISEFNWHVSIYEKVGASNEQICGGSLITTRIVITAAHCFWSNQNARKKNSVYEVAAAKHKRAWLDADDDDLVQRRGVENITIHPLYHGRQSSFRADIALVRLSAEVELSGMVNVVCVDWENLWEESQLKPGTIGTVPGWGYTEANQLSGDLKYVEMPYISLDTCFDALDNSLKPLLANDKFCADSSNTSGVSTCPGNGGGGLVILHESTNRYYLRGLVSIMSNTASTSDLCSSPYTSITQVSHYHQWIMSLTS